LDAGPYELAFQAKQTLIDGRSNRARPRFSGNMVWRDRRLSTPAKSSVLVKFVDFLT